jgi:HPt (histidine-containing phosphotransfer) domain-containing protein
MGMRSDEGWTSPRRDREPLHSEYAEDPDLREIVMVFVDQLPNRVLAVKKAFEARDLATLKTLTHQMRGSAGGYGFGQIGTMAAQIELELLGEESNLSLIQERIEDLAQICQAATRPGTERDKGE